MVGFDDVICEGKFSKKGIERNREKLFRVLFGVKVAFLASWKHIERSFRLRSNRVSIDTCCSSRESNLLSRWTDGPDVFRIERDYRQKEYLTMRYQFRHNCTRLMIARSIFRYRNLKRVERVA